jgi:hypothetical protein
MLASVIVPFLISSDPVSWLRPEHVRVEPPDMDHPVLPVAAKTLLRKVI